jgi:3-phosphoshikimate 1-carboxyvinyltransferase
LGDFLAFPPPRRLSGRIRVPPSKSATNRALILAALADSPVELVRPLASDDTRVLLRCLERLGATFTPTPEGLRTGGPRRASGSGEIRLDAGDSGTAARFLLAVAAALPGRYVLDGSARLRERPMGELAAALRSAGAVIEARGAEGFLPLAIEGGRLRSGEVRVDASRSSQFVSALLLAGVAVDGGLRVRTDGEPVSAPYVASTLEVLRDFGHAVEEGAVITVRRGAAAPERYATPGDYSSAVPLAAAVGAVGGDVRLEGLRWPSADADAAALAVLEQMGMSVERDAAQVRVSADEGPPRAIAVEARAFPDAVPSLAALAILAPGTSVFSDVSHLRLKESDRIASLAALARAAGSEATAQEGQLTISGPASATLDARRLPTFRDHRIAMAAGILSMRLPGLLVEDPGCVSKSYPDFFRDLERLAIR